MFGASERPKRNLNKIPAQHPRLQDIYLPGVGGAYQHVAREPNTNFDSRMREYKLKKDNEMDNKMEEEKQRLLQDIYKADSEKTGRKMLVRRKIYDKVDKKIKEYEKTIEDRRVRLSELLSNEERQYYYETVDRAQKGDESKLEEMMRRAQAIKANREAERLKVVEEKRLQQYSERCEYIRLSISKKLLMDSKEAQLIQILENENKKEREKEIEDMWHQLTLKEIQEKELREEQDLIRQKQKNMGIKDIWQKQIQGKRLVEIERARLKEEDRIELDRVKEEIDKFKAEGTVNVKQIQKDYAEELRKQIARNQEIYNAKKKLEDTFDEQVNELIRLELEQEEQSKQDQSSVLRRETKLYRKHLEELRAERKKEEEKLDEMLKTHQLIVNKEKDEAYCKVWRTKEKLKQDVMRSRAEQIQYNKKRAEEELKMKQMENEMFQQIHNTNQCLEMEHLRAEAQGRKAYEKDLMQQIDYNKLLKQREIEEQEYQLRRAMEEEENYHKKIHEIIVSGVLSKKKHQFQVVLEKNKRNPCCPCPGVKNK